MLRPVPAGGACSGPRASQPNQTLDRHRPARQPAAVDAMAMSSRGSVVATGSKQSAFLSPSFRGAVAGVQAPPERRRQCRSFLPPDQRCLGRWRATQPLLWAECSDPQASMASRPALAPSRRRCRLPRRCRRPPGADAARCSPARGPQPGPCCRGQPIQPRGPHLQVVCQCRRCGGGRSVLMCRRVTLSLSVFTVGGYQSSAAPSTLWLYLPSCVSLLTLHSRVAVLQSQPAPPCAVIAVELRR